MTPRVASMFRRMRSASTKSPSATSAIEAAANPVDWITVVTIGHSACQPPTARSCSCTIAERKLATSPGTRCAAARVTAHAIGLRLCGIVEEPPRPCPPGSAASEISYCMSRLTSRAILPREPVRTPQSHIKAASRSRWVCQGASGNPSPSSEASSRATAIALSPNDANVPLAPPN